MTYESMIDSINENRELQMFEYVIESFDIEYINEGVADAFKSFKNAVLGFFRKIKEVLGDFIHRITNKENIMASKGESVAKQISGSNTDQNCNIKEEKLPQVSQKIEEVNQKSIERVVVIRKSVSKEPEKEKKKHNDYNVKDLKSNKDFDKAMSDKNGRLVFGEDEPKEIKKQPEKPKKVVPSSMKLSAVFLKDSYVNDILKDSDFYLGEVEKINKIVNTRYKGNYRLGSEFWRDMDDEFGDERSVKSTFYLKYGEKLYEPKPKELYDINYTDSPKTLVKIIQDKLSKSKANNNRLSTNINKSTKLLDESENTINSIKPEQMDMGWGRYDKEGKLTNPTKNDKKVQQFSLSQLKESFQKELKAYREIIDCFKITLKEISEEILRCNQYLQVIKLAME